MRLKRLEVRGFKSFADRTEFDFNADLTGIVGPNGCGKSNVVDALKWVLGDRSAKSLRGAEMTDVIFKGAEGREGLHQAEVTIVLENDQLGEDPVAFTPEREHPVDAPERADGESVGGEALDGEGVTDSEVPDVLVAGVQDGDETGSGDVSDVVRRTRHALVANCTELRIGRRLNRDKESAYLINGEVVRLKDVRDVLMDTGLGVGAYSVMEQGRIDAVLSADPESRRAIFEEAAGISKFKIQKRETLRKLERTEQNLARVKDLLEERIRRIRGLKIQAGKARRYQELEARLRDLRAAVARLDGRALRDEESGLREALEVRQEALLAAERAVEEARADLETLDARITEAESAVETAQEQLREVATRREGALQRSRSLQDRADEQREQAEAAAARRQGLQNQIDERRTELAGARERLTELEAALVEAGREVETRRADVASSQAEVQRLQSERERLRSLHLELLHERTRRRNQAHDQHATLRGLRASLERLGTRIEAADGELRERSQAVGRADRALADLASRDSWLGGQEESVLRELADADVAAAELTTLESGLRERAASLRSRLETLVGLEAELEGLDSGPRALLEHQPDGLRGRLLDMLAVDLEDSRALEVALGPYVQALVVDTRAQAEAMLGWLEEQGLGRALLLIAEEFGARLERSSPFSLPDGASYLYRRVRCRRDAWPMVHWLLRGVCLVEDPAHARPDRTDLCFVTREGAVVCGPRLEGGGQDQSGLVVRRAQIRSLEVEVATVETELTSMQADRDAAAAQVERLRAAARRLQGARQSVRDAAARTTTDRARLADRVDHLERELGELRAESVDVRRQRWRGIVRLGDEFVGELLVRRREAGLQSRETDLEQALTVAREAAAEAQRHQQALEVRRAEQRSEREAQVHRIDALDAGLRDLGEALDDLEQRWRDGLEQAEKAGAEAQAARVDAEALAEEVERLEAERDGRQEELVTARDARQGHQTQVRERGAEREAARDEIGQMRLRLSDVEHRFGRIEERLRADARIELRRLLGEVRGFGLVPLEFAGPRAPTMPGTGPARGVVEEGVTEADPAESVAGETVAVEHWFGPPQPPELLAPELGLHALWLDDAFDADQCRSEAKGLQSQIDRLGSVNLDAVRELEDEEQRLGTLEHDVEDLSASRKSLMEALRRMEVESRSLFAQTFEQARENFRSIFRKLFQGGRADMYLTETENALESGIEIVAKPPGKELQSIALLSGGERSLTALAILFAVFKVKPSPFCILDEVDAALDETNVERFLRVLQDFVGPSQFCIVTHHKRTMAACDVLYGITMQRRGISSRISVALDEVDEFSEAPRFDKAEGQRIAGEEKVGF